MRKYVIGILIGAALAFSGQALAENLNKTVEANEINMLPNSTTNPNLPIGSIYSTDVNGVKYLSLMSPDKLQLTSAEIWMNGPVEVNSWKDVSNGTKDLQAEIDALWDAIKALEASQ